MPNSDKMAWPYPDKDADPWFDVFQSMVTAIDSSGYASREDRNIIFGGGGDVSWNATTSTLTWGADIVAFSMISGFKLSIPTGTATIADGQVMYVNLTRSPTQSLTIGVTSATSVPNTNAAMALCVRIGTALYWRWGSKIDTGETLDLFGVPGSNDVADTYERDVVFSVALGGSTQESTIGRVIRQGSLIGVSAELTRQLTVGTVEVRVKVNGVAKLIVDLTTTDPVYKQSTVSPSTYPVSIGDSVTVQVVATGFANIDSLTAGLTVDVEFCTGLALTPGTTGFGASGDKIVNIFNAGNSMTHNDSVPKISSQFNFNPLSYVISGTTRSLVFRAVASNGGGAATTHVRLYNLTDAVAIATLNFTTSTPTMQEAALVEGSGPGQIALANKIYEVRIWVDSPDMIDDSVELGSAEIRVANTIN